MTSVPRYLRILPAALASVAVVGCATVPGEFHPGDPLESMNRSVYQFNDTVDRAVFKPVAQAYQAVTPEPVRNCVAGFFGNLRDVVYAANSFLQGQVPDGINMVGRVLMNTTLGGLGCVDQASKVGVPSIQRDFGSTLAVWGVGSGPYLVLPFFGPSTFRDGAGRLVDGLASPLMEIDQIRVRNSLLGLDAVSAREGLLKAGELVDDVALDPYTFVRDAYLQRRKAMIDRALGIDSLPDYSLPDYGDDPDDAK